MVRYPKIYDRHSPGSVAARGRCLGNKAAPESTTCALRRPARGWLRRQGASRAVRRADPWRRESSPHCPWSVFPSFLVKMNEKRGQFLHFLLKIAWAICLSARSDRPRQRSRVACVVTPARSTGRCWGRSYRPKDGGSETYSPCWGWGCRGSRRWSPAAATRVQWWCKLSILCISLARERERERESAVVV